MSFSLKPLQWTDKSFSFDMLVTWVNELKSHVFFPPCITGLGILNGSYSK